MSDYLIAWCDFTINAAFWLKRKEVTPEEAAMLLCGIDPLERDGQGNPPDPERIFVDGDETSPDRYRLLQRAFCDASQDVKNPRTLLEWRDLAKREGVRYHRWIDDYLNASNQSHPAGDDDKDDAVLTDDGLEKTRGLTEIRIDAIVKTARELKYDLLNIPKGGKVRIEAVCLDTLNSAPCRFTKDTFRKAWQAARDAHRIDVEGVETYRRWQK